MRFQMIRIRVDGAWPTLKDKELYLHKERIGESLFTLFASLTYAYHHLVTLVT